MENTRNRLNFQNNSLLTPHPKIEKNGFAENKSKQNENNSSRFKKPSYTNNITGPGQRSGLAAPRSKANGDSMKRSFSTVNKSKIGLRMNGGGDMSNIVSPDKSTQLKKPMPSMGMCKNQANRRGVTLTSYSKLRNDIKKRRTDTVSNSTENFEPSSLLATPQRNTFALGSDLASMRQRRKIAKENLEELDREKDLFGDLEEIEEMRSTLQPGIRKSNQNSILGKNDNPNDNTCPFDKIEDESESSETEFDRDMDELEGAGRSSVPDNIARYDSGSMIESNATDSSAVMKHSILMSENDLETINELEDTNTSPVKNKQIPIHKNVPNKIKPEQPKQTRQTHDNHK